jgi:hypothetical protein
MTDRDDKRAADTDESTDESGTVETRGDGAPAEAVPAADAPDAEAPASGETAAETPGGDPPPIPPPLARERAQRRSRGALFAVALVVVLAAVAGGAFWVTGWDLRGGALVPPGLESAGPGPESAPDLGALTARLARMEADIKALQERPYPLPVDDTRLTALERQIKELSAALARAESAAKSDAPQKTSPDQGALSLLALAAALNAGRPFAAHLPGAREALAALGSEGEAHLSALETIAPRAAVGVPTTATLAARAGAVRRSVAAADAEASAPAAAPPPADTLWGRIKARIGGLVTIRRIDDGAAAGKVVSAKSDAAVPFATAERLLAEGKVAEAQAALGTVAEAALPPSVRDAAKALAAGVAARLAADRVATGATVAAAPKGPASDR